MESSVTRKHRMLSLLYLLSVVCVTVGSSSIGFRLSSFMLSPFRIVLVCIILFSLFRGRLPLKKDYTHFYPFWACLICYAFLSFLWAKDKSEWQSCIIYLIIGFSILTIWMLNEETYSSFDSIRTIIGLWLAFVIAIGWYEVTTGQYLFLRNQKMISVVSFIQNRVPIAFFSNTNNYVVYVVFSFLLISPWIFDKEKIIGKVYFVIMLVAAAPLLVMSKSRASILGLIVGVTTLWLLRGAKNHSKKRVIITLFAVSIIAIVVAIYWDTLWDRLIRYFVFSGYSSFNESKSNVGRQNLIKNGLHMIFQSVGLGVGAGNSRFPGYHVYDTRGLVDLHNWWLLIFSEYGVIFGSLNIYLYIKQIRWMFNLCDTANEHDLAILHSFIAIDVAFIICLISPSSVIAFEWLWVYWGIKMSWLSTYYHLKDTTDF